MTLQDESYGMKGGTTKGNQNNNDYNMVGKKKKKWNKVVNHFRQDNNKPLCIKDTQDNNEKDINHKKRII